MTAQQAIGFGSRIFWLRESVRQLWALSRGPLSSSSVDFDLRLILFLLHGTLVLPSMKVRKLLSSPKLKFARDISQLKVQTPLPKPMEGEYIYSMAELDYWSAVNCKEAIFSTTRPQSASFTITSISSNAQKVDQSLVYKTRQTFIFVSERTAPWRDRVAFSLAGLIECSCAPRLYQVHFCHAEVSQFY